MVGVVFSLILEYLIFAYFINAEQKIKISKVNINIITVGAYAVYAVLCVFSPIPIVNVTLFFVVNTVLIALGWKRSILFSALNGVILTAFMMFSELLVGVVFDINVGASHTEMTQEEIYILMTFSKLIYFICVAIFRHFTTEERDKVSVKDEIMFLILPIATCVFFNTFARIRLQVDTKGHSALIIVSLLFIAANVSVYLVYNMIADKNAKIRSLARDEHKREIDYRSYELLKERYDDLRGMIHNFEKYCNNIEGLIESDVDRAKKEIKSFRSKNKELLLVEPTNNKALNVILDQKMRECTAKGIEFELDIQNVDLSYINELDTVTVFSNLLDNATEACAGAEVKRIRLEIFTVNEAYAAVRIVNTCGFVPEMRGGGFVTTKEKTESHGIGLKSVQRALNIYGGKMKCEYDKEKKIFSTTILINDIKQ